MTLADERPFEFLQSLVGAIVSSAVGAARLQARFWKTIYGATEPLRRAETEEALAASFEAVASREMVVELGSIFSDPAFEELRREARVRALSPRRPQDSRALELRDDLLERLTLILDAAGTPPRPLTKAEEKKATKALLRWPGTDDVARVFTAALGLAIAAFGDECWQPWAVGFLWVQGERATTRIAGSLGLPPDEILKVVTARDRRLAAMPFDAAKSDEACRMLGLP